MWDGTFGLSSLSEKTRKSNHLQMKLQRQQFSHFCHVNKTLVFVSGRVTLYNTSSCLFSDNWGHIVVMICILFCLQARQALVLKPRTIRQTTRTMANSQFWSHVQKMETAHEHSVKPQRPQRFVGLVEWRLGIVCCWGTGTCGLCYFRSGAHQPVPVHWYPVFGIYLFVRFRFQWFPLILFWFRWAENMMIYSSSKQQYSKLHNDKLKSLELVVSLSDAGFISHTSPWSQPHPSRFINRTVLLGGFARW